MRIANVTININTPAPFGAALVGAALASLAERTPEAPRETDQVGAISTLTPPAIGAVWPGMGGIYAGISRGEDGQPDAHLVLAEVDTGGKFKWQAAVEWAASVCTDGHTDFRLPTRFESALLYANLRDQFETSPWYWTGTQYSADHAWGQGFDGGGQSYTGKGYVARARAVRRFTV